MNASYLIKNRKFIYLVSICFAHLAIILAVRAQILEKPVAPVREVTDDYFGTKITDPYRWMEEPKSKELADWMRAQNDYTRSYLDKLPTREKFLRELETQNNSVVSVSDLQRVGNLYFYFKIASGDGDRKIFVREGVEGEEKLLVDVQKNPTENEKHLSIISFSPSPDGKFLSYLVSAGGSEFGEIHIVETANGRKLEDKIKGTRWTAGTWLPDSQGLFYINFPQNSAPNNASTDYYQKRSVYLHKLGDEEKDDKAVFGYGVNPNIEIDPKLLPFPFAPFGSKYIFMTLNTGVSPNSELYFAPVDSIGEKQIPWRKAIAFSDEVGTVSANGMAVHGDDLYALTYKNAPRYKLVKTDLKNPDLAKAKTVIETGEAVLTNLIAAKDALYVRQNDGGISRILRVNYKTDRAENLKLPFDGTISALDADLRETGAVFSMSSWVKPPAIFAYDSERKNIEDTKLQPPLPIDVSNLESIEVKVKSYDGTLVPLSIIYKKSLKRDGKNIAGMTGYGAYGISSEPRFLGTFLPFLNAGGVVAFAHVRGGGEYGEQWHLAGYKETKPNTWKDFIACAEYLINEKYTSASRLAGHGASAGGILIGNAIAERPDLFGAAIIGVGLSNTLRYETTANGVLNTAEFGSVKTEEGFRNLLAMDAFQKIKPGVKYPAVMLTHGINDPRVEPWLSAKMAARLQASSTSGEPVLLRIDYDAGHGYGNSRRQVNEEFADLFAFIFQQLGTDLPDKSNKRNGERK